MAPASAPQAGVAPAALSVSGEQGGVRSGQQGARDSDGGVWREQERELPVATWVTPVQSWPGQYGAIEAPVDLHGPCG